MMVGRKKVFKLIYVLAIIGLFSASVALADQDTLTGTLERTADGIILSADDGHQFAVSGQDVSSLVGKEVKATGTVVEDVTGMVINITKVEVITSASGE